MHARLRQDELMEILAQAGPKGKEIVTAISRRGSVELHVHINGPIVVGADIAETVASLLLNTKKNNKP